MNIDQSIHIHRLAAELGVTLLSESEATQHQLQSGDDADSAVSYSSFRNMDVGYHNVHRPERVTFICRDEFDNDDTEYFGGLHELGHHALKHPDERNARILGLRSPFGEAFPFERILEQEQEAWEWAFENAIMEPTAEVMANAMMSYWTYVIHDEERRQAAREIDRIGRFLSDMFGERFLSVGDPFSRNHLTLPLEEIAAKRGDGLWDADVDAEIDDHGSVFLLKPVTDAAKNWIEHNVNADDYQWMGPALVVEHRYIKDIVEGMRAAGLTTN